MSTASVIRFIVTVDTDGGTTAEGQRLDAPYFSDAIWKAVEPHSASCSVVVQRDGWPDQGRHVEDLADACSGLDPERTVAERLATLEGALYDHTSSPAVHGVVRDALEEHEARLDASDRHQRDLAVTADIRNVEGRLHALERRVELAPTNEGRDELDRHYATRCAAIESRLNIAEAVYEDLANAVNDHLVEHTTGGDV
jgi:hypothetical protein